MESVDSFLEGLSAGKFVAVFFYRIGIKNQLLVSLKSCVPMINLKSTTGKEPIEENGLL